MTKQKQHVKLYHLYYLCDYMNENKEFNPKKKHTHKKKATTKKTRKNPPKNKQTNNTHTCTHMIIIKNNR